MTAIPNVQELFDGSLFVTPIYGASQPAGLFQSIVFSDLTWYKEQGGLDPLRTQSRDFNLAGLNRFAQSELLLLIDAVWLIGWQTLEGIDYSRTVQRGVPSNYFGATGYVFLDGNNDRIGVDGALAQIKAGNLTQQEEEFRQQCEWAEAVMAAMATV